MAENYQLLSGERAKILASAIVSLAQAIVGLAQAIVTKNSPPARWSWLVPMVLASSYGFG